MRRNIKREQAGACYVKISPEARKRVLLEGTLKRHDRIYHNLINTTDRDARRYMLMAGGNRIV